MAGNYYFIMVSPDDTPMFELEFGAHAKPASEKKDEQKHFNQFLVYSALDSIEEKMWHTKDMFLKNVDKQGEWYVSAFITASQVRLVMLHDIPNDDAIKSFFTDVYELHIKLLMNPFYKPGTAIQSKDFLTKVKAVTRRYL